MLSVRLLFTITSTYVRDYGFLYDVSFGSFYHITFFPACVTFYSDFSFFFTKISSLWFFSSVFPFFCFLSLRWICHIYVGVRMGRFHSNGLNDTYALHCKVAQTLLDRNRYGVREKKMLRRFQMCVIHTSLSGIPGV